jgi:hypothetical protein
MLENVGARILLQQQMKVMMWMLFVQALKMALYQWGQSQLHLSAKVKARLLTRTVNIQRPKPGMLK